MLIHSTRLSVVILRPTGYALPSTSIVRCVVKFLPGVNIVVWDVDSTSLIPKEVLVGLAGSGAILLAIAEIV